MNLVIIWITIAIPMAIACSVLAWAFKDDFPDATRTTARLAIASPLWPALLLLVIWQGTRWLIQVADIQGTSSTTDEH